MWTAWRVAHLIEEEYGVRYHASQAWRILRQLGWMPASGRTGSGAGRSQDPGVEARALAGVKKKAETEGRTIVFIDDNGLSERPHRSRTWAPKGKTPVLQYHFNWKTLSAIAGVSGETFPSACFPKPGQRAL
jgi:hypothetical protein